jgi:hypothetical protein
VHGHKETEYVSNIRFNGAHQGEVELNEDEEASENLEVDSALDVEDVLFPTLGDVLLEEDHVNILRSVLISLLNLSHVVWLHLGVVQSAIHQLVLETHWETLLLVLEYNSYTSEGVKEEGKSEDF